VNVADVAPDVRGGRRRRNLGKAAGSRWTGIKHVDCDPGTLSVVPHVHTMEEEIFVVLAGDGMLELTPTGQTHAEAEQHPVRPGTVVARPPGSGIAHSFRAGPNGLTLLAWGTREPGDLTYYPRSGKLFFGGTNVIGRVEHVVSWDGEGRGLRCGARLAGFPRGRE
jgi:uncharacterized cupin superfamily protein